MNTKVICSNLPTIALEGSLSKYLAEIKKFPMLSSEEEYMLAKSWRDRGDLKSAQKKTNKNKKLELILALNYGSKNELVNTIKLIIANKMKINESSVDKNLYTKGIPNPDILIRTGNTNRLSNFLLWQLSYSEIFFVKKMWPDFNEKDYKKIIDKFKKIKRNFGNI